MKRSCALKINGRDLRVEVDPQMPLLWTLRDTLGLTGTKFGCGKGLCGCCTVHMNGVAARSCQLPTGSVEGVDIRTIEGLSETGQHPTQAAWRTENVAQCGYCQVGQIMAAAALLDANPDPTDAMIDAAMSGNLCRCGTYKRIRKAVRSAAEIARKGAER